MGCRMAVTGLAAALFAWLLLAPKILSAGEIHLVQTGPEGPGPVQQDQPQPSQKKQIRSYLHPIRKFTIAIPPGADFTEKGEAVQVTIRSRKGFMINIQTGDANPKATLSEMVAKLEAQYLGQGKPWSRKINEGPSTVAGLEGLEAQYEGAGTRVKVIIARGRKTDFVFMFFAPQDLFDKLKPEFEWVLANFRPSPADLMTAAEPRPQSAKAVPKAAAKTKRFSEPGYGYTIQYPGDWVATKTSATIATFSGKEGTTAFQAVIAIQNVQPPSAKTPEQAVQQALVGMIASLRNKAVDVSIIGEQPLTYKNGQINLAGRQMVVAFTHAGQRYRRWALVLLRPTGTVAHIWSYTAPNKQYETFWPLADAMLQSWTIQPGSG